MLRKRIFLFYLFIHTYRASSQSSRERERKTSKEVAKNGGRRTRKRKEKLRKLWSSKEEPTTRTRDILSWSSPDKREKWGEEGTRKWKREKERKNGETWKHLRTQQFVHRLGLGQQRSNRGKLKIRFSPLVAFNTRIVAAGSTRSMKHQTQHPLSASSSPLFSVAMFSACCMRSECFKSWCALRGWIKSLQGLKVDGSQHEIFFNFFSISSIIILYPTPLFLCFCVPSLVEYSEIPIKYKKLIRELIKSQLYTSQVKWRDSFSWVKHWKQKGKSKNSGKVGKIQVKNLPVFVKVFSTLSKLWTELNSAVLSSKNSAKNFPILPLFAPSLSLLSSTSTRGTEARER